MENKNRVWIMPAVGALFLTAAATKAAEPPRLERPAYLDSTNRITASVRFGLNISGKFRGVGGSLGGAGHYADGYVLTDVRGAGPRTWYWGYDNSSQLNANASYPNSVDFHRYVPPGVVGENSGDDSPNVGFEATYDYLIGVKEDWHHLRYGVEFAFNFMPVGFSGGGTYGNVWSDTYTYTSFTTPPPPAPYRGGSQGPNFELNIPSVSAALVPGATFLAQQDFDANLFGFRLGPYIERPLSDKWSLHLSGGLAVGLLDANASWKETLNLPGIGSTTTTGGGGDFDVLWGFYVSLEAAYQFNKDWGVEAGVQFQDLGTYGHNFGGRVAELDLSQSIFIQLGISYSF